MTFDFLDCCSRIRRNCGASCTSGSAAFVEGDIPYSCTHQSAANALGKTELYVRYCSIC